MHMPLHQFGGSGVEFTDGYVGEAKQWRPAVTLANAD
jgi:hypothetical protein